MVRRTLTAALLLLAAILTAGCSTETASPPAPTVIPTTDAQAAAPTGAPTVPLPTPLEPPTTPAAAADPVTVEPSSAPTEAPAAALLPGQRSAPLGVDEGFHNDQAALVAATGRPQMIEFFTFW